MGRLRRTIALVGMMGAGKSSVGRRLAGRLDVAFRDADAEIEQAAGCSITEIFSRYGEAGFRDGERRVIGRLLREPPHILATGGGAFIDEATHADIASHATSIWLRAPIALLVSRVGRKETRPLLREGDPREIMERLLQQREPIYATADIIIDSEDGPHQSAVDRILSALESRDLLEPA
jgi:shikimate kinase